MCSLQSLLNMTNTKLQNFFLAAFFSVILAVYIPNSLVVVCHCSYRFNRCLQLGDQVNSRSLVNCLELSNFRCWYCVFSLAVVVVLTVRMYREQFDLLTNNL